jgi:hypothetical protein
VCHPINLEWGQEIMYSYIHFREYIFIEEDSKAVALMFCTHKVPGVQWRYPTVWLLDRTPLFLP